MSQQELERVEVIALRQSGQLSQAEVARRLGVTERQVRRLEVRVATHCAPDYVRQTAASRVIGASLPPW